MTYNPLPIIIQKYLFRVITQMPTDKFNVLPIKYKNLILDKQKLRKIIAKSDLELLFDILNNIGINWGIYFIGGDFDIKNEELKEYTATNINSLASALKSTSSFITTNRLFAESSERLSIASEMAYIQTIIGDEVSFNTLSKTHSGSILVTSRSLDDGLVTVLTLFENLQYLTSICKNHNLRFTEFVTLCFFMKRPYSAISRQDITNQFNIGYNKCVTRLNKLDYIKKTETGSFIINTIGIVTTCNIIGQYILWVISKSRSRE